MAEMSIMHTLVGVSSFLAAFIFSFCVDSDSLLLFVASLLFWFVFLVWLWIGLVRIAWKSGSERLGVPIFRYLQIGMLVMAVLTMLPSIHNIDDVKIMVYLVLGFDVVVAWMIINFLFLAWCARCKIPFRVYCEIVSTIVIVIVQAWLST